MAEQVRYQVFISSTYRDLKDARAAVQNAILQLSHFPIGMELFPATGDEPWQLIKDVISESDYYVLVIGGRYGTVTDDGVSYTEMEYDYAKTLDKRILSFLFKEPNQLPRESTETDPQAWDKLTAFRLKVESHHCNYWLTPDELKNQVIVSLIAEIKRHPMTGWVRNDGLDRHELLTRLTDLQGRYDAVSSELSVIKREHDDSSRNSALLDSLEEIVTVVLAQNSNEDKGTVMLRKTIGDVFLRIGRDLSAPAKKTVVAGMIASRLRPGSKNMVVTADSLNDIEVCLVANKLITVNLVRFPYTKRLIGARGETNDVMLTCWQLTELGAVILRQLRSTRKDQP